MGMSYRAPMVPMMLTVVGTLLMPISVTDTVGTGRLLTAGVTAKTLVRRTARNPTKTMAATANTHTPARPVIQDPRVARCSVEGMFSGVIFISLHPRDNFLCPG